MKTTNLGEADGLPAIKDAGNVLRPRTALKLSSNIAKQLSASNFTTTPPWLSMMGSAVSCMRRTIDR